MIQNVATRSKLRSTANTVAVCALAILSVLSLSAFRGFWNSSTFGEFGFDTGRAAGPIGHATITDVLPGSPTDEQGIRPGDTILRPTSLHDRRLVIGEAIPLPGERITISLVRGGSTRTVQIQARRAAPQTLADNTANALLLITLLIYVSVGLVLALLRPSRMTWGIYLFAFALIMVWDPCSCLGYVSQVMPTAWYATLSALYSPLTNFGAVGFLVLCIRFPADSPTGWRKTVDHAAPYLAIALTTLDSFRGWYLDDFRSSIADELSHVLDATFMSILVAGTVFLLLTYFGARGLDRHKIKWVVTGLVCATIPAAATLLSWEGWFVAPAWIFSALNLLLIPFPLTIAYAVIRHRVIDIRFVLSRSLVVGVIAMIVIIAIAGTDWLFSAKLSHFGLEGAAYAGIALLVGFSLNAARQWLGRIIDAFFFRQWHEAQERAALVASTVRRSTTPAELRGPLTAGVGHALSLASAALFERIESGGFVRTAAVGWPQGTIWHILPDDALARRVGERRNVVNIDNVEWTQGDVPSGVAHPMALMPIFVGKGVAAILLYGAHENGTAIAPDELRILRDLAADAGIVFQMTRNAVQPGAFGVRRFASI